MAGEPSRSAKEFVTLLVQSEKTGPLRILGLSSGAAEDELFLARQGHAVIASDSDIQKTLPAVQEGRAEGRQIEGRSIDLKAPIPLEDASVDAIYWRLGAQYLTNQELTQAAKEMYRVLRPGGTIYVVVKSKSDPYYQQFGGTEGSDGMVRYQDSQDKQWYSRNFLDDDAVRKIFEQFGEPTVTHSQEKLYQDIHESALTTFVGQKPDRAMGEEKGGIDLNAADSTLQVNATGQAMKFHIDPAMLERVENAPGLTPVILNIEPLDSLPAFLGLREDGGAENVVSATYGDGGRRRNVVRRVSVPVPRLRPEITQISSGYSRPYSAGSS
jgi:ubiquinone/menaquinone biosynthesis C-methylase UbiE